MSKKVEHNLEAFLFVMGLAAAILSGVLDAKLALKALEEPLPITAAVLGAGLLFKFTKDLVRTGIRALVRRVPLSVFIFLVVVVLGAVSSVITAIIAALVLVEIISALSLDRRHETDLVILACFSIGLGAALTPIGEPLSTIAVSKLGQTFWYLARLLGVYIGAGMLALGVFAALYVRRHAVEVRGEAGLGVPAEPDTYRETLVRALKVYVFVMALVLLGEGFRPAIDLYVVGLPSQALYWINTVSAVLDNATLTAAEISPAMSSLQVESILLGLLVSGGMLIPGNIPNIIAAGKLKIKSREWARLGVPLGLALLAVYFVVIFVL